MELLIDEETVLSLKKYLLSHEISCQVTAIIHIKNYLALRNNPSFVRILLEHDVHNILLDRLLSSHYPFNLNILESIKLLCSYDTYFEYDQALNTADLILKSIIQSSHEEFIISALNIIEFIFNRLTNNPTDKPVYVERYLNKITEILSSQKNADIILSVAQVLCTLFTSNNVLKWIKELTLDIIHSTWRETVKTLAELTRSHTTSNSFIYLCSLCKIGLQLCEKFPDKVRPAVFSFGVNIKEISIRCQQDICLSYIGQLDIVYEHLQVYNAYFQFLETLLKSDLTMQSYFKISTHLIKEKHFHLVAECINFARENELGFKNCCHVVITEIMGCMYITETQEGTKPYSINKYKEFVLQELQNLPSNVNIWTEILQHKNVELSTKTVIVIFASFFYIHSNNLHLLNSSHIYHLSTFIVENSGNNIHEYFLRKLWWLFAAMYTSIASIGRSDFINEANTKLQDLICGDDLKNLITFDQNILHWVCTAPHIRKKLGLEVLSQWVLKAKQDSSYSSILINAVKKYDTGIMILLQLVRKGNTECSSGAAEILQELLTEGHLMQNECFLTALSDHCTNIIVGISNLNITNERVVHAASILHFGTVAASGINNDAMLCTIETFSDTIGTRGLSDAYPIFLHVKIFAYINSILSVALEKNYRDVFLVLINSEHMVQLCINLFYSGSGEVSIEASKILNTLLDYQEQYFLDSKTNIRIQVDNLIRLLCVSDVKQLGQNMQILYKLLNMSKTRAVIEVNLEPQFVKGLYLRSIFLYCKPDAEEIYSLTLKFLQLLLCYTENHNLDVHKYLCTNSSNHAIFALLNNEEILKAMETELFEFVNSLLSFVSQIMDLIQNRLFIHYRLWDYSMKHLSKLLLNVNQDVRERNSDLLFSIQTKLVEMKSCLREYAVETRKKF